MLRLAYNTNGFPQHELADVVEVLSRFGYAGIAITPDVFHLNPWHDGTAGAVELRRRLDDKGLAVAVETGARFLLDPQRKHWPTLLDEPADAARRLDLLKRCLDLAVALRAETFSFWSGRAPAGVDDDAMLDRLCAGANVLLEAARGSGVSVCFEPEPGMAVQSVEDLGEFLLRLGSDDLGVMLDVGHVPVTESIPPHEVIEAFGDRIVGVQLDDSRDGIHEHLFPGDGEIDFVAVVETLERTGFKGLAALELPRHDFDPVNTSRRAMDYFRALRPK